MAKALLVNKYEDSFFREEKSVCKTATGDFKSKYSMQLKFKLNKFGGNTKILHCFDLDESKDGISDNMIIRWDLLSELNIDVRFSDETIKWEDKLVSMKNFHKIWKNEHPTRKKLKATVLYSDEPKATKEATDQVLKMLDL